MTNSSPITAITRCKSKAFGTNPISLAAPATERDSLVLDMATTTVAFGKVEMQNHKNEPIPLGWGQDADGNLTTNPKDLIDRDGALVPLGGAEISGGYKGTGLLIMVEILTSVLAGGNVGPNVRKWLRSSEEANLGQLFAAINPECFSPNFEDNLEDLLSTLRRLDPSNPDEPVLVAGDRASQHMRMVDEEGGIPYHRNLLASLNQLAKEVGVPPMKALE